ncbi:AI-2E family transporter [Luteimonas vadosa]|uniref:AI-2E family transporter n=1 Tax=Luteimonas vadosa TaxID=1165507 RepID=A0ABP9DWH7_9GAMM
MDDTAALASIARFFRRLQWLLVFLLTGWLVLLLAPVLTPFVLAALLAWLGDPWVDRLEARGRTRIQAVVLVFSAMSLLIVLALAILIPMIQHQLVVLVDSLPGYRDWLLQTAIPWLELRTGFEIQRWLDPDRLIELVQEHWERAGGIAASVLGYVTRSGFAMIAWLVNLVLLPVVTFFFLRDWDKLVQRMASLVPRRHIATVTELAKGSDAMLSGFIRGQLLVMLCLGVLYGVGLWLVGLDVGILIGIIGGLLSFVPYLGPAAVVVMGGIAALVQYGDWQHLLGVGVVFTVAQLIESYWLTPKLVGDRIGLHPVAVIFAVLAGGQLFGFLGMLLALPVAAVANVLLRFAHQRYLRSRLYAGDSPEIALEPYLDAVPGTSGDSRESTGRQTGPAGPPVPPG